MDTQIKIQRVTNATIGLFASVADDVFDAPIDLNRLSGFLASSHHLMIVAVQRGQIIAQSRGLIVLNPDSPASLYIDNVGVCDKYKRRGVGTKLIDELVRWSKELDCVSAWLLTEHDNIAARALYLGRDFSVSSCVMFDRDLRGSDGATEI